MKQHNNISIFIPHLGCPNCCSFCNQRTISGSGGAPSAAEVNALLSKAFDETENKENTEIAFFGGSFTAIDREYMLSLLETANRFIGGGKFKGIRVSTRPDCINEEILSILKQFNVTSIELGAQSMLDEVLFANNRGHSAADVEKASEMIRRFGFSLGLQMMVGLYKSDAQRDAFTADRLIALAPDEARIYPTVILKGTRLAELFECGEYKALSLDEAVALCAELLLKFESSGVKVIKLGLHSSADVESDMIGGIYHPAFRELCEGEIYLKNAIDALKNIYSSDVVLLVNEGAISKMVGQGKKNIVKLKNMGYNVRVAPKSGLKNYEVIAKEAVECS